MQPLAQLASLAGTFTCFCSNGLTSSAFSVSIRVGAIATQMAKQSYERACSRVTYQHFLTGRRIEMKHLAVIALALALASPALAGSYSNSFDGETLGTLPAAGRSSRRGAMGTGSGYGRGGCGARRRPGHQVRSGHATGQATGPAAARLISPCQVPSTRPPRHCTSNTGSGRRTGAPGRSPGTTLGSRLWHTYE